MKRRAFVIGIGAGDPDHLTVGAIAAMNRTAVFFVPDKGAEKGDLASVRRALIERFVTGPHRVVAYDVPRRRDGADGYGAAVADWHDALATIHARLLADELGEDEWGAFLVWGDPALYDSTMRILDRVAAGGMVDLRYEVIPGISAVQALAAAHRLPLNTVGGAVVLTPGRRLGADFPEGADSVVVMLDGGDTLRRFRADADVWWGGNLGTADEILVAGRLADVRDDIERARTTLRERRGWVMDTTLLRRRDGGR